MSIILDITPEVQAELSRQAAARGVDVGAYAATMEISRDGNRAVVDHISPAQDTSQKPVHTRDYYDLQAGKTYSFDPNAPAASCSAGRFSGDWGDPFAQTADLATAHTKEVGTDTVNGIAAKVLEVNIPGQPAPAKVWLEGKYGSFSNSRWPGLMASAR